MMERASEITDTVTYTCGKLRAEVVYVEGRLERIRINNDTLGRVGTLTLNLTEGIELRQVLIDEGRIWPRIPHVIPHTNGDKP